MGGDGGGWGAPLEAGPYGSGLYLWAGWQGSFRKMLDGSLFVPQSRERSTQHTMSNTEQNNARYSADLSEKHADKVIAYVAKMLAEDVKKELHDAQFYSIEGNDYETVKRLKVKQQMIDEAIKSLKRTLLK